MKNSENGRIRNWCAGVIVVLVCSLAVSVATRYCSSHAGSTASVQTLAKSTTAEPSRLRLIKIAAGWVPPLIATIVLRPTVSCPRIAPAAPVVSSVYFEDNLYNRPPPTFLS